MSEAHGFLLREDAQGGRKWCIERKRARERERESERESEDEFEGEEAASSTRRVSAQHMKKVTLCLVLPPGLLAGSSSSDEFRCEPCNKNLTSLTRLKRHIQNVHTRPSKEPICNICKRVYSSLNSLRNHKSIYHRQHSKNEQQRKEEEQQRLREREQQREQPERSYLQQHHHLHMG